MFWGVVDAPRSATRHRIVFREVIAMTISPLYTIHQYREDIYKVVCSKRNLGADGLYLRDPDEFQRNENKLDNNFSRARSMVLQYALCNPWDYFFTGTLDRAKQDRHNLDTFASRLMQFIRDKRKAYQAKFQVLLVPERHENGAWHIHGLVYGLPPSALIPFYCMRQMGEFVPDKLVNGGFFNWPDYMGKFGFCSLAPIRDPIATAWYITKYVSKDLSRRAGDLGKHLYFHSRPLRTAERVSDVYAYNRQLEDYCVNDYDFCKTGMVENAAWYFPYVWDGAEFPVEELNPVPVADPLDDFDPGTVEPPPEIWEQTELWA